MARGGKRWQETATKVTCREQSSAIKCHQHAIKSNQHAITCSLARGPHTYAASCSANCQCMAVPASCMGVVASSDSAAGPRSCRLVRSSRILQISKWPEIGADRRRSAQIGAERSMERSVGRSAEIGRDHERSGEVRREIMGDERPEAAAR